MPAIGPEQLGRFFDENARALALYARQWSDAPEDVVQDAFVSLARQQTLPDRVVPWLYRVVRNGAIAASRGSHRRQRREEKAAADGVCFASTDVRIDAADASRLLAELDGETREVIVARIWGGLTFEEVARLQGCSLTTAVPLFKYRLLPLSSELNPGDAAPLYLRIRYEVYDRDWEAIGVNATKWLELPLEQFPIAEARKFVDSWSRRLQQIEFGARRKTCEWNYTLPEEQVDVIGILMPDAAGMRTWSRLLILKARVEASEGKFDDAIRTMETGIAFGRHVAEGPFLVNQLVGIAIASAMLTTYDDLVSRPGAPNLYWALTALPRPLIGLREGLEQEMKIVDRVVPELSGLDRTRTDGEWSANLERLHMRLVGLAKLLFDPRMQEGPGDPAKPLPKPEEVIDPDLARFTATVLPFAREYLRMRQGLTAEEARQRPTGRAIAEYLDGAIRERRDEVFRIAYLPYTEAVVADRSKKASPLDPAFQLFEGLFPGMHGLGAEARLDRRVAALRAVEALRMYAATHGEALPESLDTITEVPVPLDPVTGKPFGYHLEGGRAEVSGSSGSMAPVYRLSYGITVVKRKEPVR